MKTASKNSSYSLNKLLGFLGMLGLCMALHAQKNIVQNPSFEQIIACPNDQSQLNFAVGWGSLLTNNGFNMQMLCARCALGGAAQTGVPMNNGNSYQETKTGDNYAYIGSFEYTNLSPNFVHRGYAQNHLIQKLRQDKIYCVKMWVSLFNESSCSLDEMGLYFDDGSVTTITPTGYANVIPQVKSPSMVFLSDTLNWMLVEGTFMATGNEEYLTIGNFRDNANTHYQSTPLDPQNGYLAAGYYIDDVSVIESDLPAFAGNDTALLSIGDSVFLGREPEIGLECVWYDMQGNPIGTGAGFWVHPTHTTSYIVEQNLCGNIKRDTVTVSLGVDIAESAVLQGLSISPNPTQGTFRVSAPFSEAVQVQLLELSGKQVYEGKYTLIDGVFFVNVSGLAQGVYVLQVQDVRTGQQAVRRVLVE